jgi:hypothetical protein
MSLEVCINASTKNRTEWTARLLAVTELARLGYDVSVTSRGARAAPSVAATHRLAMTVALYYTEKSPASRRGSSGFSGGRFIAAVGLFAHVERVLVDDWRRRFRRLCTLGPRV